MAICLRHLQQYSDDFHCVYCGSPVLMKLSAALTPEVKKDMCGYIIFTGVTGGVACGNDLPCILHGGK